MFDNEVDQLLNTHPLKGLKEKLESLLTEPERKQYLRDPKWGIIRALAQLHQLGASGMMQYQVKLEQIDSLVPHVKGVINKLVQEMIKQMMQEDIQEGLTPGADISEMDFNKKGLIPNHKNIKWLARNHRDIKDLYGFDMFSRKTWLMREPVWGWSLEVEKILQKPFGRRPFIGDEVFNQCAWFNDNRMDQVSESIVRGAIKNVSFDNKFDYLRDVNDARDPWDRIDRLFTFAERYFKLDRSELSADMKRLVNIMFGNFLIGMMARCYSPGCAMKHVLVLEGEQHIGKSGFLRLLFHPFAAEHSGRNLDLTDPDTCYNIVGAWGIELGEMSAARKSDIDTIKDFESRLIDIYRPKFHEETWEVPRRFVIATTVNPGGEGLFNDRTGNVRKFPIPLGQKRYELLDFDGIKAELDQVMAEAKHRYMTGESWELSDEEQELHNDFVSEREIENPASYHVEKFIEDNKGIIHQQGIKLEVIMEGLDSIKLSRFDILQSLKALGLVKSRFYVQPKKQSMLWYFKDDKESLSAFYSSNQ